MFIQPSGVLGVQALRLTDFTSALNGSASCWLRDSTVKSSGPPSCHTTVAKWGTCRAPFNPLRRPALHGDHAQPDHGVFGAGAR